MDTATAIIAQSDEPVTTRSGHPGLPSDVFTAVVASDGFYYEYVFRGDHQDPDAVSLGRVGHSVMPGFGGWCAVDAVGRFRETSAASRVEAVRVLAAS